MNIAFVWQGSSNHHTFTQWNDGLRQAMKILKDQHTITFHEPWDEIKADVVLYWEAPCTVNGANAEHYNRVRELNIPKALLFAGGPLEKEWVQGFNLLFIESQINVDEAKEKGIPHKQAFGINDEVFDFQNKKKIFDGIHHGTCASWKRQALVGESLKGKGLLVGRNQATDPAPFQEAEKHGAKVLPELPVEIVCDLINRSHTLVQTSDANGGGQRATLEAMACGVPPIVMTDSPKNREFVEECGIGIVCDPNPQHIQESVERLKKDWNLKMADDLRQYVKSKWSARDYAQDIIKGLISIC